MTPSLPTGTIVFENVTKTYEILQRATPRLGAWVLSKAFEYFRREPFHALEDLSFRIEPGEMVGFIGHNGAGKSSILKLVAGITQPTSGRVTVSGPVTSLLELGVGFHPELTGMENIFYNGAIMGLSRQQILDRLETIIAFSELADFLYEPVKHYSSGMYSRLGCSVALHLDPKIMLVDEILAVGDSAFQQKSIMKLLELHAQGVTILLVTHETQTAAVICGRLIWLEHGRVREAGDPGAVNERYQRSMLAEGSGRSALRHGTSSGTDGSASLASVALVHPDGSVAPEVQTDRPVSLRVVIEGTAPAVRVGLRWRWSDHRLLAEDLSPPQPLNGQHLEIQYQIARWPLLRCEAMELDVLMLDAQGRTILSSHPAALLIRVLSPDFHMENVWVRPKATWLVEKQGMGNRE